MKHFPFYLAAFVTTVCLMAAGCTQPAPAPTPTAATKPAATTAPAAPAATAPAKAAEPTKPAAAAPTTAAAAPAKKVDYPIKGKPITLIVPWAAGASNDVVTRLLAFPLEAGLGTPVEVVNRPGAGTQVGITELTKAAPDGHTLANTATPATQLTYADPARKAPYGRKDIQPIAAAVVESQSIYVKGDSPYKTANDLVDAAKANPKKIKIADQGNLSTAHMVTLGFERAAGVKFAAVHFDGASESVAAVAGGHVDACVSGLAGGAGMVKSGELRIIANTGTSESKFVPGVKSLKEQGYNTTMILARGISAPGGTPREIVDKIAGIIKSAVDDPAFKKKMDDAMLDAQYLGTADFEKHWDETDALVKVMIDDAKAAEPQK